MNNEKPITLASGSPRRAMLLRDAGIAFEAVAPRFPEPDATGWAMSPAAFAEMASNYKARSVADEYPDRIILGADTVVAYKGQIHGKPTDREDARRILSSLSGTTHKVITGVTLLAGHNLSAMGKLSFSRRLIRHAVTRVSMRAMNAAELEAYLETGDWQGKAGAYGIQDSGDAFVTCTQGSFSNIVGLPVELVTHMLAEIRLQGIGNRC